MRYRKLMIALTLLTALFTTSCRSSRQMTTELIRKEVVHDTVFRYRTLSVQDTILVRESITVVLSSDSTEKSRTTIIYREHTRNSAAAEQETRVLESERLSEDHTTDIQTGRQLKRRGWKAFLWGFGLGILVITIVIIFVRLRKR